MNWFMKRKEKQIENKIQRYKEKVAQSREEYQKSTDYPLHMSHAFLQHLNLISNSLGETEGFGTDYGIEWIALYKEMVQKYPAEFEEEDLDKIQESLQKSIECSCDSRLLKYYLNDLENNSEGSFLVVPIAYKINQTNGEEHHAVGAILKKRDDKLIVDICDKAAHGLAKPEKVYINKSAERLRPFYRYKFKTSKKSINVIAKALRIGRKHIQMKDIVNPFSNYKKEYYPLKKLDKHADAQSFIAYVGTSQYLQRNCHINNLDATLREILAPEINFPRIYRDNLQMPIEYVTPKMYDSWRDNFEKLFQEKIKSSNFEKNVHSDAVLEFLSCAYKKYLSEKKLTENVERGEKINVKNFVRENEAARFKDSLAQVFRGEKVDLSNISVSNHFKYINAITKQFAKQFGQPSDLGNKARSDAEHTRQPSDLGNKARSDAEHTR